MNARKTQASDGTVALEKKVKFLSAQLSRLLDVVKIDASGNVVINSRKKLKLKSQVSLSVQTSGPLDITAEGNIKIKGSTINLN